MTAPQNRGLTLIEILVVIGILIGLFAIGSLFDTSSLSRQTVSSEQAMLVSILQKARSRAMNNVDHVKHGVHIDPSSDQFVIFEGSSYVGAPTDEEIPRNTSIVPSGATDAVFDQLSGNSADASITLTQGPQAKTIDIKANGLISW
jgi:Tfp pilus assembly protein FimT